VLSCPDDAPLTIRTFSHFSGRRSSSKTTPFPPAVASPPVIVCLNCASKCPFARGRLKCQHVDRIESRSHRLPAACEPGSQPVGSHSGGSRPCLSTRFARGPRSQFLLAQRPNGCGGELNAKPSQSAAGLVSRRLSSAGEMVDLGKNRDARMKDAQS
jgi:hypothetical protein